MPFVQFFLTSISCVEQHETVFQYILQYFVLFLGMCQNIQLKAKHNTRQLFWHNRSPKQWNVSVKNQSVRRIAERQTIFQGKLRPFFIFIHEDSCSEAVNYNEKYSTLFSKLALNCSWITPWFKWRVRAMFLSTVGRERVLTVCRWM